jgi:hypothetical protein
MIRFILLILFLILVGCDKSPQWKIYYKNNDQTIVVDENSIKRKDNFVSFWYILTNPENPDLYFQWKKVYDCKKEKSMTLFYDVPKSINTLPKSNPDLTDEDHWFDVTKNLYDRELFNKLCKPTTKKTFF